MARMNPRRRLAAKVKSWDQLAHNLTVQANTEPLQSGKVRSALNKPAVGFQGTFRAPKQVPDGADAPAFYKAGGRSRPQKPTKVTPVLPSHGRTNVPKSPSLYPGRKGKS